MEGADRAGRADAGVGAASAGNGGVADFRVTLDGVHLKLGDRQVFRGLSCGFPRGRISVVLGGSGGGKSTLLRLIGGLLRPDRGSVRVAGRDLGQLSKAELFRERRRIGMLFQHGALLDSMTLFDNVALPLREHSGKSEAEIAAEVSRGLEAVGLPQTEHLYPRQLSGGMVRRAALARAVVMNPEIVLCDEPFSGLDPVNVRRIESLLVELNRRLGITMIVTSHHVASTLRMADRVVYLEDGTATSGTPQTLRSEARVAAFLAAESDDYVPPDARAEVRLDAARGAP
jgi:phospholipid/cholesterol/gamma-HCH transport system ATP-binding protein